MKVTKVMLTPTSQEGSSVLGYGTVTFDDVFCVEFKIMKSSKDGNLFVNWPSYQKQDKTWKSSVYFYNEDKTIMYNARNEVSEVILNEYNSKVIKNKDPYNKGKEKATNKKEQEALLKINDKSDDEAFASMLLDDDIPF